MKIVINLDKYQLEHCKRHVKEGYSNLIEEAVVKGDMLDAVLDKIKTKINKLPDLNPDYEMDRTIHVSKWAVYDIIDKYKEGDSEEV